VDIVVSMVIMTIADFVVHRPTLFYLSVNYTVADTLTCSLCYLVL